MQGEKIEKEIKINSETDFGIIAANRDRSDLVAVLAVSSDSKEQTDYKFYNIDLEKKRASRIAQVSDNSSLIQLTDFEVSDDGRFVTAAGEQDHKARLVLVDIKRGTLAWDKTYDKPDGFGSVVFSFDSKTFYAGGSDGAMYYIQASDGKVLGQYQLQDKAIALQDTNSIKNMILSSDGSMLAYIYGYSIGIFDCMNKVEIPFQRAGHKVPGPIVFSPDSTKLATSDLRQSGKIIIQPIPEQ